MSGIIFFDSDCLMCDSFVQWVARKDNKKHFYYTSGNILKNDTNEDITSIQNLNQKTILYLDNSKLYQKSTAVQKILFRLGFFYSVIGLFFYLFPEKFRDYIYDFISKHRKFFLKEKKLCSFEDGNIVAKRILWTTNEVNRISAIPKNETGNL